MLDEEECLPSRTGGTEHVIHDNKTPYARNRKDHLLERITPLYFRTLHEVIALTRDLWKGSKRKHPRQTDHLPSLFILSRTQRRFHYKGYSILYVLA